eukprot:11692658-Ditylum_brightwellii.AAC.1
MLAGAMMDNGESTRKLKEELDIDCKDAASMEKAGCHFFVMIRRPPRSTQLGAAEKNNMNGGY